MGRPPTDGDVEAAIVCLADRTTWTASKILLELGRDETLKDRLPGLRTVQRLMKPRREHLEAGDRWRLGDASPEEAPIVMEALATIIEESDGGISEIPRAEADWIVKIKQAVPAMPTRVALRFAREYMSSDGTAHLDAALAVARQVVRGPSGETDLDEAHVARHVALHVRRWIHQPLLAWAGSRTAAGAYIREVGHHASLSRSGEESWFDNDFFGRLIIESARPESSGS